MRKFNLIEEKWIPVRFLDGNRDELGISDTLLRSREIAAIEDPSPLVVAALHRFLLAVLYRALEGPTDIEQAKALFTAGLPGDRITVYLDKWEDRFWLFDGKYPFWQVPTFEPNKWRNWAALAVEYNADTAKVLFDHTNESDSGRITFAAATRWLLATQTFAVSTGKSEISHTGTAPSAGSIIAVPVGQTLHDTLLFNLVPQNRNVMECDFPIWERTPDSFDYLKTKVKVTGKKDGKEKDRTIERTATGIIDLYTWRTRSVVLKKAQQEFVSEVGFASGVGYLESMVLDPMIGHIIKEVKDEETKEKIKKRFALQFDEKGIWRDFDSLLPDAEELAPKVIENAAALCKRDRKRAPIGVLVLGQKYFPPRPNIAFWRAEYFILPEAISGDSNLRFEINQILSDAEKAGFSLKNACELYAKDIIGHGGREVDREDILKFVNQMTVLSYYWSTLESQFHSILGKYTFAHDSDDIRCQWLQYVRRAMQMAWNQYGAAVSSGDAWAIRALIKAEKPIRTKLKEINEMIKKLAPETEEP
ncbi:MAG: type I-E CRISPR-associated protein Cse1/CasA [Pedobacter sp.]